MATRNFSFFHGFSGHQQDGGGGREANASADSVRIFLISQYKKQKSAVLATAEASLKGPSAKRPRYFVIAQPVNGERLGSEELQKLNESGITVVPVSGKYIDHSEVSTALRDEVLAKLEKLEQLEAFEQSAQAPVVDKAAAEAVNKAFSNYQGLASPQHRQDFLDEFYGPNKSDDGVR